MVFALVPASKFCNLPKTIISETNKIIGISFYNYMHLLQLMNSPTHLHSYTHR